MEFGKIEYKCTWRKDSTAIRRTLRLTLIGPGDKDTLDRHGLRALRQARTIRLTREACEQGCLLGYDDLAALLLTSPATLRRDVAHLCKMGQTVELRGRRRNGKHRPDEIAPPALMAAATAMAGGRG